MEWFSYAVAVILFLSSVISPIATTLINNYYQAKSKNIKIYQLAKRKALEQYVKYASKCYNNSSDENVSNYIEALNNLYIYFKDVPDKTNSLIYQKDADFTYLLTSIVQVLSKQISKE